LIAEGLPLNALQKQLGHANLATTSVYVNHLGAEDVIAIGRERSKTTSTRLSMFRTAG